MGQIRKRGQRWWIRYHRNGRLIEESSKSNKKQVAIDLLRIREGDGARGLPVVTPRMARFTWDEAAKDVENDYTANGRSSLGDVQRRIKLHLTPFLGGRRLQAITTDVIRSYVAARLQEGAAHATVNRELAIIKRAYRLALEAGRVTIRPSIAMLEENNVRRGFFSAEQFEAVRAHLPEAVRPVVTFAYLTGWRLKSEILPLTWSHVDWHAREIRLDPGVTKNRQGRVFPFTVAIEALLKEQRTKHDRLKSANRLVPWIFHRDGAPMKSIRTAWSAATTAAGCPGRIVHDFRRSAVRNLEGAGVPRSAAMAMVGHKTESIYRRYAIVDDGMLRDAASKIDAVWTAYGHFPDPQKKAKV